MTTALLEPVIHITAANKNDPEFREKYGPNKNIILTIPDGTTEIRSYAFYEPVRLTKYPELTEVHFPESLTTIGEYAFSRCTGLTQVHFPESLTTIETGAFNGCTGLTELHLPESLTDIGTFAFAMCTGLTEVQLPESLTTIEEFIFDHCTGLTEVHLPESLTDIGRYAFDGCTGLTDIYFPSTKLGMLTRVRTRTNVNFHCPAVARFMTGDSFEMELIVRRNLGPAEFRADLKAQVRSALEERGLLEGQDFDIPDYFTKDRIVGGEVDFKQELIVIWL